jgi:hypothetical protein
MMVERGQLAGNFFFFRGAGRRSTITHFLPTIAYQLSRSVPGTETPIQRRLQADPHIASLSLAYQFTKLIIEPIRSIELRNPVIFVFDGLDECDDRQSMAEFIEVMIDIFNNIPGLPLKVLCTSRVEEHIRGILESVTAQSITCRLNLEDFDADDDIHAFLQSRFVTIYDRNRRYMPRPWPSPSDLSDLVQKCEGSFLFAATLIDFINSNDGRFPHQKMEAALRMANGLDPLYAQVISAASQTSRDHHFERVLGALVVLTRPLAITSLGDLLQLGTDEILQPLLGMQSILSIPGEDDKPVQLVHTSLRDFLTTERRSRTYFINPATHHFAIAMDCLGLVTAHVENDVPYNAAQKYACRGWFEHLERCLCSGDRSVLDSTSIDVLLHRLPDLAHPHSCDSWVNMLIFTDQTFRTVKGSIEAILNRVRVRNAPHVVQI